MALTMSVELSITMTAAVPKPLCTSLSASKSILFTVVVRVRGTKKHEQKKGERKETKIMNQLTERCCRCSSGGQEQRNLQE